MNTETPISELAEQDDLSAAPTVPGEAAAEDQDLSVLDLLILLAERKRTILLVPLCFAVVAAIISLILPKSYTGMVTLLPPQDSSSISSTSSLGGVAALLTGGFGMKSSNEMYVSMFKSRTVEDAMVQRFGLMQEYHSKYPSDAVNVFDSHTKVDGSNKDGLIRISVTDADPRRAAELANGYVDEFRDLSKHLAVTEASQRRLFFQQEMEEAKNNLADAEEAMKRQEQQSGVMQLDLQARELTESAATLRGQIAAKKVQIEGMEAYATGENSQLVMAQRELESLRAQLAKVGGSEDSPGSELVIPKGKVPEASLEYIRKLRDVKYYETIFDILARQFEAAKLDEAKQGAIIQVVDPAIVPDRRSFPKRALIVIFATAIGLFFGVLAALLQGAYQLLGHHPSTKSKVQLLGRALSFRRRA